MRERDGDRWVLAAEEGWREEGGAIGREKEGESGRRISQSVLQHLPDMGQSTNDKRFHEKKYKDDGTHPRISKKCTVFPLVTDNVPPP